MNNEIVIEESCLPSIQSGEYRISAQIINAGDLGESAEVNEEFRVDGSRFSLGADDVRSVFPGDGLSGGFEAKLPHAVLNRKTLPWERSIAQQTKTRICLQDDSAPTREIPWLCILLLHEHEITEIRSGTVGDVLKADGDIFFPSLHLDDDEKEIVCNYTDIPLELFKNIVPSKEEMAFLVHARKNNPGANSGDTWVSVAAGNRLPQSGDDGGTLNKAYLVSMEGFDDWEQAAGTKYKKIRLVVLYSWSFYSVKEKVHFYDVCEQLDVDRLRIKKAAPQTDVDKIEDNGYVPLAHHMRQGSKSISFYRGPFSPAAVKKVQVKENWSPDSLYRYDPELGVFDVSYACAWQLGRLLSLESAKDRAVQKARSESKKRIRKQQDSRILCEKGIDENLSEGDLVRWTLDCLREKKGELL